MRNDRSTAFLSHSLTRHVPSSFSATRSLPASSSPSAVSTPARTSADAFCAVIFARDSKAGSMVACSSLYDMMFRYFVSNLDPGRVAPIQRSHQGLLQALARLFLCEASFG